MKKKWIRFSLVGLAIALATLLVVAFIPAGVSITQEGFLSLSSKVVLAVGDSSTGEITRQSFSPDMITYYFDVYHSTEKWTTTPEYMADSILINYASTTVNNQVERLTNNTCPGDDLGTITKVEIRAYAHGDSNDELYIRPEFIGGAGDNHITVPGTSEGWGAYQNITNDTNAPDWSSWTHIQDLELDIEYDKTGSGANMFVSKVEIRVTYSTGAPKGGSVAFVRATEGSVVDTVLTLNIEVSAGTDRVLVVGLAYKSSSVVAPTSIVFNTSENFTLEKTAADGGDAQVFMYYLAAPTETTADVVITMPGSLRMVGYVAYFTGVAQIGPFTVATSENMGTNNAPTVDVSSAADEIIVSIMAQVSAGPDTIDSNSGTLICSGAATGGGSDTRGGGTYETGQATTSVLYGVSDTDNWNIIAGALQEPWLPVSDIDIGSAPIDRAANRVTGYTSVDKNNPANASGTLHSIKVYASANITGLIVGTFYIVSGNTLKCRDSELIGDVEAGAERTFTELSITVETDDYIGCWFTGGSLEMDTSGGFAGVWRVVGEYIDPGDETEYTLQADNTISLYGYGDVEGIDVGATPIDRSASRSSGYTRVDKNNPANASGTLHSVKVYTPIDVTGFRVGTFYTTNGNTLKCRDSVAIGDVARDAERTFTSLDITVETGDYIGAYWDTGAIDSDAIGFAGEWYVSGEYIDPNDETTYGLATGRAMSLYGYGDLVGADISNAPTSKGLGVVSTNTTYWSNDSEPTWPLVDGDAYFTVTNNSSGSVSIAYKATNFTGGAGWNLTSGSPGEDTVRLTVFIEGDGSGNGDALTTSDQTLISSLGASSDIDWEFKFETGTFTDGDGKTSTITLTATLL